jgi:hypothetical protein
MVWALSISYKPRSLFATGEGERSTKGSVHPVRHPRVHLGERASAQQETSLGARDENLVEAAEEGKNYLLQLRLQHLLQLGMRISLGKTRK